MAGQRTPSCFAALFPQRPAPGPLRTLPSEERALMRADYVSGRIHGEGSMMRAMATQEYKEMMAWFLEGAKGTSRSFAWTAMWRWVETSHYLDEVTLAIDSQGNKVVSFNGGGWHGKWFLDNTHPGPGGGGGGGG